MSWAYRHAIRLQRAGATRHRKRRRPLISYARRDRLAYPVLVRRGFTTPTTDRRSPENPAVRLAHAVPDDVFWIGELPGISRPCQYRGSSNTWAMCRPATAASRFPDPHSLLKDGNGWEKLPGAFRVSSAGAPYRDTIPFARALVNTRPDRMVWATIDRMPRFRRPCLRSASCSISWPTGCRTKRRASEFSSPTPTNSTAWCAALNSKSRYASRPQA